MNITEWAKKRNAKGFKFDDRIKGKTEDILDKELTLIDYEFHTNARGEYVTVIFEEFPEHFFFGGKVLTDFVKDLENEFGELEAHKQVLADGVKLSLTTAKSRAGFSYTKVNII